MNNSNLLLTIMITNLLGLTTTWMMLQSKATITRYGNDDNNNDHDNEQGEEEEEEEEQSKSSSLSLSSRSMELVSILTVNTTSKDENYIQETGMSINIPLMSRR
jgi:hypothetical protein